MQIQFLGTGAGKPVKTRNVTSILFKPTDSGKEYWLFDAGEGTQQQLLKTTHRLTKVTKIFITHLHGDHIFGLPGLISSRSAYEGSGPLEVYGPYGVREFIETALRVSGTTLTYPLTINEYAFTDGIIMDKDGFSVAIDLLDHRVESYGFRIEEAAQRGTLDAQLLKRLGVPAGPLYGRLKNGEDITLADGTLIRSEVVVGADIPGRVVAIMGDTRYCDASVRLAFHADVLVHEATMETARAEDCYNYGHSTIEDATRVARLAEVGQLYITHFSSRYDDKDIEALEADARLQFPQVTAAHDLQEFTVERHTRFAE
jgi:ribonuclease Z